MAVALFTRLAHWRNQHTLALLGTALVGAGLGLIWPGFGVVELACGGVAFVALWGGLGALEPALVALGSATLGLLWTQAGARVGSLALPAEWSCAGLLAGASVGAALVFAGLCVHRGQSPRVWERVAGLSALAVLGLGAGAARRGGLSAALAWATPTLSAAVFAPLGMRLLLARAQVSGAPKLRHLLGGALGIAFLLCLQVSMFLLVEPQLRILGVPRERRLARLRAFGRAGNAVLMRRFPYGRREFLGFTRATLERPSILVSNHQSALDIPIVLGLPADIRLTLKERVWKAPYFGIAARRLGHVLVEKDRPEATLERCRIVLAAGASVHFFPEGTRANDLYPRRFHRGAFDVAVALRCPVVPVVLCDTRQAIPRDAYWVGEHHIVVRALEPVTPETFDYGRGPRELMLHVQALVRGGHARELRRINTAAYLRQKVSQHYRYLGRGAERRVARELREPWVERLLAAELPEEGLVHDLDCGLGVRANFLRELCPRLRVQGFDEDERLLVLARRSAAGTERLSFTQGKAESSPRPDLILTREGECLARREFLPASME
jgi:1-acyl-sn-glycerol-3-phosphate acyltransferase